MSKDEEKEEEYVEGKCLKYCQNEYFNVKTGNMTDKENRNDCKKKCWSPPYIDPRNPNIPCKSDGQKSDTCMPHLECNEDKRCSKPKPIELGDIIIDPKQTNSGNNRKKGYGKPCQKGEECIGYLSTWDDKFNWDKSVGCYGVPNKVCKYKDTDKHINHLTQMNEERIKRFKEWNESVDEYITRYEQYLFKKKMLECRVANKEAISGGKKTRNKKENKKKPYNGIGGNKYWNIFKSKFTNNKEPNEKKSNNNESNKNKVADCCDKIFGEGSEVSEEIKKKGEEERARILELNTREKIGDIDDWVIADFVEISKKLDRDETGLNKQIQSLHDKTYDYEIGEDEIGEAYSNKCIDKKKKWEKRFEKSKKYVEEREKEKEERETYFREHYQYLEHLMKNRKNYWHKMKLEELEATPFFRKMRLSDQSAIKREKFGDKKPTFAKYNKYIETEGGKKAFFDGFKNYYKGGSRHKQYKHSKSRRKHKKTKHNKKTKRNKRKKRRRNKKTKRKKRRRNKKTKHKR